MDVIYRFDPDSEPADPPGTPAEAVERLQQGNENFVRESVPTTEAAGAHVMTLPATRLDLARPPVTIPKQAPFAIVLGCSDARVPTEIVFNQSRNDMFIVRVAGNVLGSECLGSIEYAATNLADNLRLVVVLGHDSCGAVTAAVDAFMDPAGYPDIAPTQALRAVIDRIFVSVRAASRSLRAAWGPGVAERNGYRAALIDVSVGFNAALTAWTLRNELPSRILDRIGVVFGIFDLATHRVWTPSFDGESETSRCLATAPADREAFRKLEKALGDNERVRALLGV